MSSSARVCPSARYVLPDACSGSRMFIHMDDKEAAFSVCDYLIHMDKSDDLDDEVG